MNTENKIIENVKSNSDVNMEIDIRELLYKLYNAKKSIFKTIGISLVIGLIIAFSLPKTYKVDVTISPESGQNGGNSSLGGMASMLGFGNMSITGQDAINSTLFPDLVKSTPFIIEMYNIKVQSQKIPHQISFSEYIIQQKKPWWNYISQLPHIAIKNISAIFSKTENIEKKDTINPFKLTGEQSGKINLIRGVLSASEDKKNGMTIVSVTLQDPEIAAIVADSVVKKLQEYIIKYRTSKAIDDCEYLNKLCQERKQDYLKAQQIYADFMDTNRNMVLQKTQAEATRLQNDMSIAFQVYSQIETQLQVARAKVQEAKPVFAIVEPASVPLAPTSPNKPLIIIGCVLLGFLGSSIWILFGNSFWNSLKNK